MILEERGRTDEAVQTLRRAASVDSDYPQPHYALSRIYRQQGRTADAARIHGDLQTAARRRSGTDPVSLSRVRPRLGALGLVLCILAAPAAAGPQAQQRLAPQEILQQIAALLEQRRHSARPAAWSNRP